MANRRNPQHVKFTTHFGSESLDALTEIVNGGDLDNPRSAAAYKANLTRGTYHPYLYLNSRGRLVDRLDIRR